MCGTTSERILKSCNFVFRFRSFEMVPPGVWIRTVQLKTMLRWLKRGDCKCAYLVPVFLLHTLHVKPYQSDDQTPVFHIMREQISKFRFNELV